MDAPHLSATEMRQAIVDVLPRLGFHRGQTLTKSDEVALEWVCELLAKAAHLCDICEALETKGYADETDLFTDYLCAEHVDLARGPERV